MARVSRRLEPEELVPDAVKDILCLMVTHEPAERLLEEAESDEQASSKAACAWNWRKYTRLWPKSRQQPCTLMAGDGYEPPTTESATEPFCGKSRQARGGYYIRPARAAVSLR